VGGIAAPVTRFPLAVASGVLAPGAFVVFGLGRCWVNADVVGVVRATVALAAGASVGSRWAGGLLFAQTTI